ncbi:MAG: cupredoxin domain-containing protein, partial [Thermomicrobiales bacterium]|nr:cupredoxin domain-containing protein [Thermomicrobiales bacterium]
CTGEIRGLQRDEAGVWQFQNLLDTALQITGSGQDANGDLYVTTVTGEPSQTGQGTDSVWKLVAADKVPEGAVTVPLGHPRTGDVSVDENGAPLDAGNGPTQAEAPATPAAEAPAATTAQDVAIDMYDMYFEPNRITIPANTDVRFVFTNRGQVAHNFSVNRQDISVDVEPGGTGETIVNLPAGTYKFVCNVPGHKQVGMNGSLIVK